MVKSGAQRARELRKREKANGMVRMYDPLTKPELRKLKAYLLKLRGD